MTPRYANGRAARLKPERLQVRILLWVLNAKRHGSVGNWQTTLARAPQYSVVAGMLWVRIPPELLTSTSVLVEQSGVLTCLSRRRSRVQIPSRALEMARYANWQSGEAQTFCLCGFDSHPRH